MALKCTKTSPPSSCEMNPYPLSALNHLTVPVATVEIPLLALDLHRGLPNRAVMPCQSGFPSVGSYQSRTAVSLGVFAMNPGAARGVLDRPSKAFEPVA